MPSKRERKLISKNRSAHHEYFIDETFECGIELSGTEVKSIRERACQITDTFALIRGGECWLVGLHIHPYSHGGVWNRDPDRRRRLLLHRKEIDFLDGKLRNRGYALVPLELYFNTDGRVKLLLGLGRGKKLYDKREDMAKRDVQREIDRALNDHELIKVRVPSDDREELESIYAEVAEKLGAARVQMIGKLLIFWRPADESERQDPDEAARLAILSMKTASVAGKKEAPSAPAKRTPLKAVAKPAKKVASKKPGEKKKATSPIPVRSRSKKNRVTKKGAGSRS